MSKKSQEKIFCELCGNKDNLYNFSKKRGYKLYECHNCGLIFVHPKPSDKELERIYSASEGYYAQVSEDLENTSKAPSIELMRLLKKISVEEGRILEFGCASGALLYHMKKKGWDVFGVEINKKIAEIARKNKINVKIGSVEKVNFKGNFFDVVYMGDVLEHVSYPGKILSKAFKFLKNKGVIVVKVPNANCNFAKLTKPLTKIGFPWPHSEAPYHLTDFNSKTLSRMLEEEGFEIELVKISGRRSFGYLVGASGYFDRLKKKVKISSWSGSKKEIFLNLPKLIGICVLFAPFYLLGRVVDSVEGIGDSLTVFARKKK